MTSEFWAEADSEERGAVVPQTVVFPIANNIVTSLSHEKGNQGSLKSNSGSAPDFDP